MLFWYSRRSRGAWRPSPFLSMLWLLTKLSLVLTGVVLVLMFMYYALAGSGGT